MEKENDSIETLESSEALSEALSSCEVCGKRPPMPERKWCRRCALKWQRERQEDSGRYSGLVYDCCPAWEDEIPDAQHRTAQQCGLISQEFLNQGRYGEAEAYAQAQLRKAHLEFDDAQTEKALSKLGRIHRNVGNLPEAAKFYQRSLNLSQQMCDKRSEAIALDQIGGLHLKGGDPAEAIKYYNKSLAIHERLGNLLDIGVEFGNIGSAYLHLSEFKKAKETLEKAVEYSTRAEDSRNLSIWYFNLGQVHEQTEHSHDALDSYKKSWILNKLVGDAQLDSILRVKLGLQDR